MSIFTNWPWVESVAKYMNVCRLLHLMQMIKTKKHYLTPGGGGYPDILIHLRYLGPNKHTGSEEISRLGPFWGVQIFE